MDDLKIPYIYHDGRIEGVGKPRHGFYSGIDGKRAEKRIEGLLYAQNPGIRHRQEVLFDAVEQASKLKSISKEYSQDEIRKASYETLMQIMQFGTSESARLAAAKELLDRIDGKPQSTIKTDMTVTHRAEVVKQVLDSIVIDAVPKYIEGEE